MAWGNYIALGELQIGKEIEINFEKPIKLVSLDN
jgi:hypothetical protein